MSLVLTVAEIEILIDTLYTYRSEFILNQDEKKLLAKLDAFLKDHKKTAEALKQIKALVEKEPCSIIGAYNLRAGIKHILAEVQP